MNELRSTEILDKQIQLDARKKAEHILASAKKECEKIKESFSQRIENAKQDKKAKYEEQIASFEKDKEVSIPLEKQRFFVSFIQESVNNSINEYVESLTEEEKLNLVLKNFTKYQDKLKSQKVNAYVYGFDLNFVKKELSKLCDVALIEKTEFNRLVVEQSCGIQNPKGIILETENKNIRARLTLSEVFTELQEEYKEELYKALFNGGLK